MRMLYEVPAIAVDRDGGTLENLYAVYQKLSPIQKAFFWYMRQAAPETRGEDDHEHGRIASDSEDI